MKRTTSATPHPFVLILALLGLVGAGTFTLEPVALAQVNPSWIATGSLNTPRSGHTATLLPQWQGFGRGGRQLQRCYQQRGALRPIHGYMERHWQPRYCSRRSHSDAVAER